MIIKILGTKKHGLFDGKPIIVWFFQNNGHTYRMYDQFDNCWSEPYTSKINEYEDIVKNYIVTLSNPKISTKIQL